MSDIMDDPLEWARICTAAELIEGFIPVIRGTKKEERNAILVILQSRANLDTTNKLLEALAAVGDNSTIGTAVWSKASSEQVAAGIKAAKKLATAFK